MTSILFEVQSSISFRPSSKWVSSDLAILSAECSSILLSEATAASKDFSTFEFISAWFWDKLLFWVTCSRCRSAIREMEVSKEDIVVESLTWASLYVSSRFFVFVNHPSLSFISSRKCSLGFPSDTVCPSWLDPNAPASREDVDGCWAWWLLVGDGLGFGANRWGWLAERGWKSAACNLAVEPRVLCSLLTWSCGKWVEGEAVTDFEGEIEGIEGVGAGVGAGRPSFTGLIESCASRTRLAPLLEPSPPPFTSGGICHKACRCSTEFLSWKVLASRE